MTSPCASAWGFIPIYQVVVPRFLVMPLAITNNQPPTQMAGEIPVIIRFERSPRVSLVPPHTWNPFSLLNGFTQRLWVFPLSAHTDSHALSYRVSGFGIDACFGLLLPF